MINKEKTRKGRLSEHERFLSRPPSPHLASTNNH
jgi:hypothetical protein